LVPPSVSRCTSYLLLALTTIVFIKNFWLNEDAFIIFRSLEQLQAGNGAVWNSGERVQIYTSVAWYWLLAAFNAALHSVFVATTALTATLFLSLLALTRRMLGDTPSFWLALALFLLSKSFFDYTSSGLENILAYCTLLALYSAYHGAAATATAPSKRNLHLIAILTSCIPLVRHDLTLLCALPFAWLLWSQRRRPRLVLTLIAIAIMPLFCWTVTSLIYYGLPLPNTAYAKLNHGIDNSVTLQSGFSYFYWNALYDPLTSSIIVVSSLLTLGMMRPWQRAFAAGALLYCLYLLKSGGDYMLGRFLSFPFLISVLLLADWIRDRPTRPSAAVLATILMLAYVGIVPSTPVITPWIYGRDTDFKPVRLAAMYSGNIDQRLMFYSSTLAAWWLGEQRIASDMELFRQQGESFRIGKDKVVVHNAVGISGYYAGLDIHIVDSYALADPFLAQLPGIRRVFMGHFERQIVPGYIEHLRDGVTPLQDAQLNQYYAAVELMIRSPNLLSPQRLKTIAAFNLGYYDHLLDDYRRAFAARP